MRQFLVTAAVFSLLAGAAGAETIKASVNGLVCSFCATGIEKIFNAQPAVEKVHVDLDNKLVTIDTKANQELDDATVTKLITDAGYSVTHIAREK
jgi:mercuric ion binding protein